MKFTQPLCFLVLSAAFAAPAFAQTPSAPPAEKDKLAYALGFDVGENLRGEGLDLNQLKKQGFELDQKTFLDALRDGVTGAPPKLSPDETKELLAAFGQQMKAKKEAQVAAAQASGPKNKQEGQAFLAANKGKPGVVTLPDGLQYKVVQAGTGPLPAATDTVTVKYRGTLIDGTVFDSSDQHGGTAKFPVNHVIPGWTEALQKMKVGSKWTLYVPSELAYGDKGAGTDIAPGATLIFDVELDSIAGK